MPISKIKTSSILADAASTNLNIDAGTLFLDATNNRVGVGTTSPTRQLQVSNASNAIISALNGSIEGVLNATTTNVNVGSASNDFVTLSTNGTERVRIDTSGNVGIGNTNPASYNASSDNLVIGTSGSNGMTIVSGSTSSGYIMFADGTTGQQAYEGQITYDHTSNFMAFNTTAAERMRIDSSGNVGIGTTSPATKLQVNGTITTTALTSTDTGIVLQASSVTKSALNVSAATNQGVIGTVAGDFYQWTTGGKIVWSTNSGTTAHLVLNGSGDVGINNTSPAVLASTTQVAIKANTSADSMFVAQNSNGLTTAKFGFQFTGGVDNPVIGSYTNHPFLFQTNNTERMRINSAGEVFIGGTTQGRETNLSVEGTYQNPTGVWTQVGIYSTDTQAVNKGGTLGFGGQDGSVTKQQFSAIKGAKENGTSGNYAGYMAFFTRPAGDVTAERMRIDSSGVLNIGLTGGNGTGDGLLAVAATGTGAGTANTRVFMAGYETTSGNAAGLWFGARNNGNTGVIGSRTATGNIAFETYDGGWAERMRLTYQGKVGVGTTSITSDLLMKVAGNLGFGYHTQSGVFDAVFQGGTVTNICPIVGTTGGTGILVLISGHGDVSATHHAVYWISVHYNGSFNSATAIVGGGWTFDVSGGNVRVTGGWNTNWSYGALCIRISR